MATDDYKIRQEDELQVLQSIYGDDVHDLRTKAAWNAWSPNKIKLKLYPQESQGPHSQVFAEVEMIVTCSTRYPDDVPIIELQNSKNLSDKKLNELKVELMELARQSLGEVMIMELAEKVREFLHVHNKPPSKSFYDQMMDGQRMAEEERIQKQREQQEKERCKKEEEMRQVEDLRRRRQQELMEERNETRCRKGVTPPLTEDGVSRSPAVASSAWTSNLSPIVASPRTTTAGSESTAFTTPAVPAPTPVQRKRLTSTPRRSSESEAEEVEGKRGNNAGGTLVFSRGQEERHVQRGKQQTSKGGGGSTVYCGRDINTGEAVAVTEWVFKWRTVAKKSHIRTSDLDEDKEGLAYLKQVKSIEQEALQLVRLSHPNIIRHLGFRYQREPGKITVHVLSEYCGGSNLGENLRGHNPVPLATLQQYTQGMVGALHYLHENTINNVVHKLFRASCVFVDSAGQVRLSDYAIDKRLRELYKDVGTTQTRVKFEDSTDRMPPTLGRGNKKRDIYQLGVTVLALSVGDYITDTVPKIPDSLPPTLVDFLNRCLVHDERQRWTTSQLLEHPFLKEALISPPSPPSPAKQTSRQGAGDRDVDSDEESLLRTSMEKGGKSRLTTEFHIEKRLGKGGFGDVVKVKNKLDGQVYAIKRIMINPRSKHMSEKITREVNLLSRLNHENIVRYYNAWIEFTDDPAFSETSSGSALSSRPTLSSPSPSLKPPQQAAAKKRRDVLDQSDDDIERMAPQAAEGSVDWSFSQSFSASAHNSNDFSSDDDDEDDDGGHWGVRGIGASLPYMDEDSVGFEEEEGSSPDSGDHNTTESESQDVLQAGTPKKSVSAASAALWAPDTQSEEEPPRLRCLYIQMQYCEKSTLRCAIDEGLYKNMDQVWRYFREITEGLLYIHEQKMIHRDLKPVNIFLDANDLVKIGDFGLATTDIVKQKTGLADSTMTAAAMTEVGTAHYVSPEMMKGGSKLRYDQKVDIYSLGIIFFEMVYKNLGTSMERILVLTNLRRPEIIFPDDFNKDGDLNSQVALLRQMLNHDPSQRPSSKDLLQSPHLPAVQEAEAEFNERLEEAVRNPESQSYRRILTQFFSRSSSTAEDMTYNMETRAKNIHCPAKFMLLQDLAKERIERVFKCHGAVRFNTPLLMPRPKHRLCDEQLPCFLDKSGAVVSLPIDLRLPFARYVGHNSVPNLKRYSIERVYRQVKVESLHPREVMECAFDIVTMAENCLPEAQLLVVVQQVIDMFPVLQSRSYMVCMNHTKLIEAMLINAGVPEDMLSAVMETLLSHQSITEDTIRATMRQHRITLTSSAMSQLKNYLNIEGELSEASSRLRPLTRHEGPAASAAKEGLHELENIQSFARDMGLKMKIIVWPCLMYELRQHSGLIFQVYHYKKQHKKQKARDIIEVIATGGRYDKLVSEFSPNYLGQRAVGVRIAFDSVLNALIHETELQTTSPCDVVVCTIGHKPMLKERLQITRNLLAAGIRTEILYESLKDIEELQDRCRASGIPFLVLLKDTRDREENGLFVRVKMLDSKTSGTEKRINATELVDMIQQRLAANRLEREAQESGSSSSGNSNTLGSGTGGGGGGSGGGGGGSGRSNEQENYSNKSHGSATFIFTYATKIAGQAKRRIEQSVFNKAPRWLTGETDVVVVDLPEQAIRTIQAFIELNKEDSDFNKSVTDIINVKLVRYRKYLTNVMDHIREIRFEKKKQHLLLYGFKEDTLRLLT